MSSDTAVIVVDTSVLINGEIVRLVSNGMLDNHEIIVPTAVLDELQSQASQRMEQGYVGLEEVKELRKLSVRANIKIRFTGERPSTDDIALAESGRIDALITDVAKANDAILFTSDRAQSMAAQAGGVQVQYHSPKTRLDSLEFLRFFDEKTMSVHLKENLPPMAKRGMPGKFELVRIEETLLTRDYLHKIINEIVESAKSVSSGNAEISKPGAMVIQYNDYRIAITKPPFSDKLEITIVHPTVTLTLADYSVSEKLMERFANSAEGVIISGAPGSGKSTLASGLANFYHQQGKVVKTFESPRDLQVEPGITQYTKLDESFENSADLLLLVRPDYTIFDEVRRREDFEVYSDLRLTGVGMVGVVHANSPIDSIQRFIGKVELGMIPSVLDTIVFIKNGAIEKVYSLELKVKVPSGMTEQDLARPVIEITNFEDDKPEYEIYTFGEENVIIPVTEEKEKKKSGVERLAEDKIREIMSRYDPGCKVEILSETSIRVHVAKRAVPAVIGRGGSNISELEKKMGLHIDITPKEGGGGDEDGGGRDETYGGGPRQGSGSGPEAQFEYAESGPFIIFNVDEEHSGKTAYIFVGDRQITSARVGRRGQIKLPKRSPNARKVMNSASSENDIRIRIRDR